MNPCNSKYSIVYGKRIHEHVSTRLVETEKFDFRNHSFLHIVELPSDSEGTILVDMWVPKEEYSIYKTSLDCFS